jgi:folate-binding protein YgfZ
MSEVNVEASALTLEYTALRAGAGLIDLSGAGLLEVSGTNSIQFLNGLVSNDVKTLAPGEGVVAAFLNVHGQVLALCRFYQTGRSLLLELAACNRAKILQNLNRFVPAGEFFLRDLSDETALLSLQGPQSGALLASLIDGAPGEAQYSHQTARIDGAEVRIAAHSRCGTGGYDIFAPSVESARIWRAILDRGAEFGARAVGREAFETARIEAGIASEPQEIDESHILLETGRHDAVSYTKGCYLGQEIIARIHWRGRPAKQLTGLWLDSAGETSIGAGSLLFDVDGKKVGEIKSLVHSPRFGRQIALAYVHRNYLTPGTRLTIRVEDREIGWAEVTALPFALEG